MKKTQLPQKVVVRIMTTFSLVFFICGFTLAQSPVDTYGLLHTSGNKIVDKNNNPVSLAGNSLFWSNAGWGGEKFYNASVVNYVKSDWNSTIIRAAMGVEESGGYLENKNREKQKVKTVVDAAISAGIYVIIDWHTHHAEDYRQDAITFFTEMATLYANRPNVIFEIYNEPLQISWTNTIKPYAEAVIGAIRGTGANNLIIVGTSTWSQRVDEAAANPITQYSNIAYTLHFYAATHKQDLRNIAQTALNSNLPIFVTEWGSVDASGGGSVDETSTNEWMAFLKQNKISHLNWALNDKQEAASALNPGVSATGGWEASNYTQSGTLVRNIVRNWSTSDSSGGTTKLEAESYTSMSGISTETTTDIGGGLNVGWIDAGDWMTYNITIPATGSYTVSYRVASSNSNTTLRLEKDAGATQLGTVTIPNTGGWQNWTTVSHTVTLPAGSYSIGIATATGGFNLNYISIASQSSARLGDLTESISDENTKLVLSPNPTVDMLQIGGLESVKRIRIYDLQGKEVFFAENPGTSVNISSLSPGLHIAVVEGDNAKVFSKKIVKR